MTAALLLLAVVAAVAVAATVTVVSSRRRPKDGRTLLAKGSEPAAATGASLPVPTLDKAQIAERLGAIAADPPPAALHPGAMCYAPRASLPSAEYVCPTCGARTTYPAQLGEWISEEVPRARRAAARVTGIAVRLDESGLCLACSPRGTPTLALDLLVAGDAAPRRVEGISSDDLRLLDEFGRNVRSHAGHHDFEAPLKDSLARLEQLLGVRRSGP